MTDKHTEAVANAIDHEFNKNTDDEPSSYQLARAAIAAYQQSCASEAVAWLHTWEEKSGETGKSVRFSRADQEHAATNLDRYLVAMVQGSSEIVPLFAAPPVPAVRVKPLVSGETIMKADVEKMITDWQLGCADHPALWNQGNVLLTRLKSLRPSLSMTDFLTGMESIANEAMEPPAPAGWKLVPLEPTIEMLRAGSPHTEGDSSLPHNLYRAMIAAAPGAP
jgi:hypothetical protein